MNDVIAQLSGHNNGEGTMMHKLRACAAKQKIRRVQKIESDNVLLRKAGSVWGLWRDC